MLIKCIINLYIQLFQRFYDGSDFSLSFEPSVVDDAKEGFEGNFTVKLDCISQDSPDIGISCKR